MGFTDGCRYWSILQVVAIILCYRGSTSYSSENGIYSTAEEQSTVDDITPVSDLESTTGKKRTMLQGDAIFYSTTDEQSTVGDIIPVADPEASTETSIAGVVICCLIILLVIIILVYALYQRRKAQQAKPVRPSSMTEVYNRSKEVDVDAYAAQGTRQQRSDVPLSLYTVIEETPTVVYSELKQTEATNKDDQSERVATDRAKAVTETQAMELNVYTTVNTLPTTTSTDSTLKADHVGVKGVADKGDSSPDQVYSLASNVTEDIYAKEAAVDSPAQLEAGTASKYPMPQDDGCQTVIENDLYGTTDSSAKATLVDASTHALGGIVSKAPAPEDDGGQTVIENELYGTADNGAKEITVSPPTLLLTKL